MKKVVKSSWPPSLICQTIGLFLNAFDGLGDDIPVKGGSLGGIHVRTFALVNGERGGGDHGLLVRERLRGSTVTGFLASGETEQGGNSCQKDYFLHFFKRGLRFFYSFTLSPILL